MAIVESRVNAWGALTGQGSGQGGAVPTGERQGAAGGLSELRPALRPGLEIAELISQHGIPYILARSSHSGQPFYLRLTPEELRLAELMDGTRTMDELVAAFADISGRMAPGEVARVVADLRARRMLDDDLPSHPGLRPVEGAGGRSGLGAGLLGFLTGRRVAAISVDLLTDVVYRIGGRLLFTRAATALALIVTVAGFGVFVKDWAEGTRSLFLTNGSYLTGAAALLAVNLLVLATHEAGRALATKHAGRRVPVAGLCLRFGLPGVSVDATDAWMAGRRGRLIATATGPAAVVTAAGAVELLGLAVPGLAPAAFKFAALGYLSTLIALSPFLALDGTALLTDWLEIPNIRARALAWLRGRGRVEDAEGRLIARYALL
ncbi:MAG: cyclic nucleotide-binding protein, partial [Dactylosporangium sp.]|nr:cyclic nucleotide-binding protein [Dactylosporangium sp.]NNJ63557.1 cyclic nucleotide-binding protein [Dactylosporangium sp.]